MAASTKVPEMNEAEVFSEVSQQISRYINCLGDPNRNTRKKGLEAINKEIFASHKNIPLSVLMQVFDELTPTLAKLLTDPVEKCRELALNLLQKYLESSKNYSSAVSYIIPILVQRLGQQEITEPSEEIRDELIQLMAVFIQQLERKNAVYLDDYIKILSRTICDPFPEAKKHSCHCASVLAKSIPADFHQQSESLISPLLQSITHQHSKVRVAVVNTIGQVLLYGNNKNVDDVVPHLAQRLFDQAPIVREAVTRVSGMWLLDLPDRYSFWHKLMPLLLTSLTDEIPSIQEEAASLWHDVGIRYMRENESDLKEKEDFEAPQPAHYPAGVERPNLGCRELMYRNQSKFLPGLSRDILDWVLETRKKSAALLCTVVINAESSITQHMQLILDTVYKAAIDEDKEVVANVEKSAKMLGYFVKPEVWVPLVLPVVEKHQHYGSILALTNLVRGSECRRMEVHLPDICRTVRLPDVCTTRQLNIQLKIIDFVDAILSLYAVGTLEPIAVSFDLFTTLMSVCSVAADESVAERVKLSIKELALVQGLEVEGVYREHTLQLLDSFGDSYLHWNNHSVERLIFDTLLIYSGPVVGDVLDKVVPMLTANMNPEKDADVRLKLFSLVSRLIQNAGDTLNSSNKFGDFSVILIRDMILPNCIWKAGRTATAIRTVAVSCLWCVLKYKMISTENLLTVVEEMLTQLLSLMEDDELDTRLITCRVLMHMLTITGSSMDQHRLYNMYPHMLKRLDDSNDYVRIAVCKTFEAYFDTFAGGYEATNYKLHLEDIIKGLLIHMDDPDSSIQEAVRDVLKKVAHIQPAQLVKEIEVVQHKHRSTKYCEELITYCEATRLNSGDQG